MKHTGFFIALAIVAGFSLNLMALPNAEAAQAPQTDFEPTYRINDTTLALAGVGQLKYLGFIRIYNGALYLPEKMHTHKALDDVPKRLEVKYLRSFKSTDFGPATIAGLKKNVDSETFVRIASRVQIHNSLYDDIAPGDRVSLTYVPSVGTQVAINGKTKGTIQGADFAAALFSLWLGERPFDEGFKRALLGEK